MKTAQGYYRRSQEAKVSDTYKAWKAQPSDKTFGPVLKELGPTIDTAITSFAAGNKKLRTRAQIMAAQAINNWDPAKGAALNTHVYNHLKGLNRVYSKRNRAVHIPENVDLDRRAIERFRAEYKNTYDIDPSDTDISDGISISLKRISRARGGQEYSSAQASSEKGDLPVNKRPGDVWMDYVYHDSDTTDKKIIEWTTGYNDKDTMSKVAIARKLKMTPAAVSFRINRIIKKMESATNG